MLSKQGDGFLPRLFKRQYYPAAELDLTVFCLYQGWLDAARAFAARAAIRSTALYPELYHNTGSVFFQMQDKERAMRWLQKFLETGKDEKAERMVQFMRSVN
ncbi:MAG: hypothetical protein AB1458_06150 [Bacteroidota bacterium]